MLAASLARAGLDAGLATLDGPTGMNRLMVGPDYEQLRDTLTHIEHGQNLRFETGQVGEPLLLLSSGLKLKRFPNCGSAHRAMDGLAALIDAHGFGADEIEAIHVRAPVTHLDNLMYTAPEDALQARFSLEYALACLAVDRPLHARRLHRRGRDAPRTSAPSTPASTATRSTRPKASSRPRSRWS